MDKVFVLIYECVIEGDETKYFRIFANQESAVKVFRSLRDETQKDFYFNEWAETFNCPENEWHHSHGEKYEIWSYNDYENNHVLIEIIEKQIENLL